MVHKNNICILGAGRMGRGIALTFAYAGYSVHLVDIKKRPVTEIDKVLNDAKAEINQNLAFLASMRLFTESELSIISNRITYVSMEAVEGSIKDAEYIFEAVPELLDAKKNSLALISAYSAKDTIVASTTSSFLVDTLSPFIEHPERYLNTHWLNPAYIIPIVEVSHGTKTSDFTLDKIISLLKGIGKIPITCSDSPGYVVPRLQALTMNEAARLAEEGVATVEEIDKATRYGFGFRFAILGLLEFIDWGGGDTLYYASNFMKESLNAERYTPPDIITTMMKDNEIGMKSGKGFYDFSKMDTQHYQQETIKKFVDLLTHLNLIQRPSLPTKQR